MSPEYKHICKALSFRGKRLQRGGKVFFTIFAKKQIRTTRGRSHTSECQRGGHETCALWVLSRAGKVPRPPAGGRNLSQGTDFLWKAGESPALLFCFAKGFASAEATKGLSGRPLETFGVPPLETDGGSTKNGLLWKARKMPALLSLYYIGFRSSTEIMTRL